MQPFFHASVFRNCNVRAGSIRNGPRTAGNNGRDSPGRDSLRGAAPAHSPTHVIMPFLKANRTMSLALCRFSFSIAFARCASTV